MDFQKLRDVAARVLHGPARRAIPIAGRPPEGMRVYAVGDIHGRADLLQRMFSAIRKDAARATSTLQVAVILLGDLIDRGMQSREVVDLAIAPELPPGFAYTVLMGNHERMLLDFMETGRGGAAWLDMGGAATAASYDCAPPAGQPSRSMLARLREDLNRQIPERHRHFLRNLPVSKVYEDYLFVHAGIHPGRPLARQRDSDMLWIRTLFLRNPGPFEKIVVHGHNITEAPEMLHHRIGVDTGAYATGVLSAIVLEAETRRVLQVENKRLS